jgi:hypothetical protein
VLGGDDCGVMVPPEDPHAMSEAILRLLRDPGHAATVGRRLFTRVTTQFSWTYACARYMRLALHSLQVPAESGSSPAPRADASQGQASSEAVNQENPDPRRPR